jgi:hypothetical protein
MIVIRHRISRYLCYPMNWNQHYHNQKPADKKIRKTFDGVICSSRHDDNHKTEPAMCDIGYETEKE